MTVTREHEIGAMQWTGDAEGHHDALISHVRAYGPSPELMEAVERGLVANVVPSKTPTFKDAAADYSGLSEASLRSILTMRDRQLSFLRTQWVRDAKEALAGKPQMLRNRVEMYETPPVEITNGS